MTLEEVFNKGKHDPRLRIDGSMFDDKKVLPINHNGNTVGFYRPDVSMNGNPRVGAIYVLPEYRRMGLAKKVVSDFYKEHKDMVYITTDTNSASQALAKSVGLQHTGRPIGNRSGMIFEKVSSLNDDVSLRPHQVSAVNFIEHNRKGILAHGTGLGKTLTSIAAFERLKEKGNAGRALVIVPASLRSNYVNNIKKFTNSSYSVYGPKNEKNSKKVGDPSDSDYNIISYELFRQDPQGIKDRLGADTLIIDEVHRARNESSGINRELTDHTPAYRNVITLTGSVVNNAPSDISPLMDATFGRGGNTVGTRSDFNRRYVTKARKGGGFLSRREETFSTMHNRNQLSKALGGKVHYVSHSDLDQALPPVVEETVRVPMTDDQKKLYLYSFKDLPPVTKAKIRKNIPVSQKEMSGLFAKLMQSRKVMTDPASMDMRLEGQDPYMYSPKVKRVIDDMAGHLSESPRNKVVVYGNLLGSQIDTVKNVLDSRNVPYSTYFGTGNKGNNPAERDRNLKDYMSGKNRVLLISGAGGEGLDLKGTSMMQMLEGHYNPEKIQQAEARVRRMGDHPDKPIQIKQYVSTIKPGGMDKFMGIFGRKYPTSIDEYIYTVADRKDKLNQDFRDSLMKGAMHKTALDAIKARALAESVGIIPHPKSNWKWALRQLRAKNPTGVVQATEDLMLKGKDLAKGKEKIGLLPNNVRQKVKALARKQRLGVEVGAAGKSPKHMEYVAGEVGRVELPSPKGWRDSPYSYDIHTHPAASKADAFIDTVVKNQRASGRLNLGQEVNPNFGRELSRMTDDTLSASPSGTPWGVQKNRAHYLKTEKIKAMHSKEFEPLAKPIREKAKSLIDKLNTSLDPDIFSDRMNRIVKARRSMYDKLPAVNPSSIKMDARFDIPYSFGGDYRMMRSHSDKLKPGTAVASNIMSAKTTSVNAVRPKLPNMTRTVYFKGGLE